MWRFFFLEKPLEKIISKIWLITFFILFWVIKIQQANLALAYKMKPGKG